MARALSLGLGVRSRSRRRCRNCTKTPSSRLGVELGVPLEYSLSCMSPVSDRHCGQCSKCRERREAFAAAGVSDRTTYAAAWTGHDTRAPG